MPSQDAPLAYMDKCIHTATGRPYREGPKKKKKGTTTQ
jgi:hypothetical protein